LETDRKIKKKLGFATNSFLGFHRHM
jgi:hypothetical protein